MTHKHEWAFGIRMWVDGTPEIAICMVEGCDAIMKQDEIERRLNAVECLRAEDAGSELTDIDFFHMRYCGIPKCNCGERHDRMKNYARALEDEDA